MKKIFISIICISMFFSLAVLSFAYYDYSDGPRMSLVIDDADLLDASDEQELCQKLEEISNTYECEIAVLTVNSTNGMDITAFTDDFYDYNGYGYGENDDGLLFAIDMGEREFAISTHGKAIEIFTDYNLDVITNSFTAYLSDADYATAFSAFLNSCSFILSDYQNYINNLGDNTYTDDDNYIDYDDYYSDFYGDDRYDFDFEAKEPTIADMFSIKWIGIALIIGIVAAFIYTSYLKSQLKSVGSKPSAKDYVVPGSFNLTQQRDIFMYSNVKKHAKPKNNTSSSTGRSSFGGGSSTHTSSSGRTHGGTRGKF